MEYQNTATQVGLIHQNNLNPACTRLKRKLYPYRGISTVMTEGLTQAGESFHASFLSTAALVQRDCSILKYSASAIVTSFNRDGRSVDPSYF